MKAGYLAIVSGRWDSDLTVVHLDAVGDGTRAVVVSRPRVTFDAIGPDGPRAACGLPVSVTLAPHLNRLFVVNHAGQTDAASIGRLPHGHRGCLAVLDLAKAIDPAFDGTTGALLEMIDLEMSGPVGCALTPTGHLLVTSAEGDGTEDGGYRIAVVEAHSGRLLHHYPLQHQGRPAAAPSPSAAFGRYPNPNGIAVSSRAGGLVFTANGGTDDVAVLRLPALLAREANAELGRVPLTSGGFGIALSPDQRILAVAERESASTGNEASFVSLIDTERAATDPATACLARIRVGSDEPGNSSRCTGVAFSPDGGSLYVTCNRTGLLSRLDVAGALSGQPLETRQRLDGAGAPAFPRGVATTPDGRFVVVAGGARGRSASGVLWVLDAENLAVQARLPGVGNEPYFLSVSDA